MAENESGKPGGNIPLEAFDSSCLCHFSVWLRNNDMPKEPLFTYGDQLRRKAGGPVLTVQDITATAYHFDNGTFALIDDQDCYQLVGKASGFFRVARTLDGLPLADYLHHGYETRDEFRTALRRLTDRWGGRIGEYVSERNKFLLLRFPDTPGGVPDEAWLPLYMLTPCERSPYAGKPERDPDEEELNRAFGFD